MKHVAAINVIEHLSLRLELHHLASRRLYYDHAYVCLAHYSRFTPVLLVCICVCVNTPDEAKIRKV